MKISPVPSPLPAIQQSQQKQYRQYIDQVALIAVEEDKRALDMGDVFLEVEEVFGRDMIWDVASQAGVSRSKARQRVNVSRNIPKGHYLRDSHLSFSHLRLLASTENLDEWGKKCLESSWTCDELDEALKQAGDTKAQELGAVCLQCNENILFSERMICFSIQGQKRGRLCGPSCAETYFHQLTEIIKSEEDICPPEEEIVEPSIEIAPDLEPEEREEKPRRRKKKAEVVIAGQNGDVYSVFDTRNPDE